MTAFVTNSALRNFNSHAHVERDDKDTFSVNLDTDFNSHAHVERDNGYLTGYIVALISTHTLTWSVTTYLTGMPILVQFQLTRSRGA